MPQTLMRLIQHCQSTETGVAELGALIAQDAAMTAKVMRAATSSAYRRTMPVETLLQALMTLGVDMVKTLVISESVFELFDEISTSTNTSLDVFWRHSLSSAVLARLIAARMGYPSPEEAYLAGLLHDIGRLALLSLAPREYAVNFNAADDDSLCAIEQRTLQMTHAEAGAWLVESWHLDSFIADSLLYHHEPDARLAEAHPLIRIVSAAHQVAGLAPADDALAATAALCKLGLGDLATIRLQAATQLREAAVHLGIDLDAAPPAPSRISAPLASTASPVVDQVNATMRRIVLASEVEKSLASQPDRGSLLETATRSACILFGFNDAVILLSDDAGESLHGTALNGNRQRLAGLRIPIDGGGMLADAMRHGRVAYIGAGGALPGLAEEQLQRSLAADCLVCVALGPEGKRIGALIGALASWQLDAFRQREAFLLPFAAQVTRALSMLGASADQINAQANEVAEEYRQASRRVVHEVNNPLSIIKNYLGVLNRKLMKKEAIDGEVSILHEEIDRVGELLNGLVDLTPLQQPGNTRLNRTIADVIRLFTHAEARSAVVDIQLHDGDDAVEVACDANTLKQIMVNLIKNAVEALPDGGKIDIGINGMVNRDARMFVGMYIRDNGKGMPLEVMNKLFSPLDSTKGDGHRGLGLNIVHGLVLKSHGHISCRSNAHGTTFELLLPVAAVAAVGAPAMPSASTTSAQAKNAA